MSTQPSILWLASYFLHPSGQAEEARAMLRALEERGYAPAALKLKGRRVRRSDDPRLNVELRPGERELLERQLARTPAAPCVAVHHYVPREGRDPLADCVNVARAMFETDRLPSGWHERLAGWPEVWVTSEHNRRVFVDGGFDEAQLRLIPQTLDFEAFRPDIAPCALDVPPGHFVFLANFDFSERKGWRQLVMAWARAFGPNDPVCLVLKTGSVARWDEDVVRRRIEGFLRRSFGAGWQGRMAPLRIEARMLSAAEIPPLYSAAGAYVSASRGEAWGRPYMEAMAMGLPTVGSRYGGNLDFMNDRNSWLVGGELVAVDDTDEVLNPQLYRGHRWFEVDVDELAAALREIAGDPAAARRRAAGARAELLERFAPELVADRIMDAAREVAAAEALAA